MSSASKLSEVSEVKMWCGVRRVALAAAAFTATHTRHRITAVLPLVLLLTSVCAAEPLYETRLPSTAVLEATATFQMVSGERETVLRTHEGVDWAGGSATSYREAAPLAYSMVCRPCQTRKQRVCVCVVCACVCDRGPSRGWIWS
jgi:hypothetical protein